MIDSSDPERIRESSDELHGILEDDNMLGIPVVIIANKQDMPNVMSCNQIVQKLELEKLRATRNQWFIQSACAVTGEGIYEAMKKMSEMVKKSNN